MAITINGSSAAGNIDLGTNGTITDLAVGGLPDGTVDGDSVSTIPASKLTGALPAISGASLTGLTSPPFASYAYYEEQQASGTNAGTMTSGTWHVRALNTEVADPDSIGALSSNKVTLAAGTYFARWAAPAREVDRHQTRLYNDTDSSQIAMGATYQTHYSGDASTGTSTGATRFTISGTKDIALQHKCNYTTANYGQGLHNEFGINVYARLEIFKEA